MTNAYVPRSLHWRTTSCSSSGPQAFSFPLAANADVLHSFQPNRRFVQVLATSPEDAAHDIQELRGLLEAVNTAKHAAWQTAIQLITTGFLLVLVAGAVIKLKVFGGEQ
jgi:hypothetical protein